MSESTVPYHIPQCILNGLLNNGDNLVGGVSEESKKGQAMEIRHWGSF